MRPAAAVLAAALFAVSCSGEAEEAQEGCAPLAPVAGGEVIFDGTEESLERWAHAGPGSLELQEDCTLRTEGGLGLLWHDDAPVEAPATVVVEWRAEGDSNSGVFVGFPAVGDDPLVAVDRGYEVQIDPADEAGWTTGAIYGFQPAEGAVVNDGWNTFEIRVAPPEIVVSLNGVEVNRFTSTDPARSDLARGFVGLQNHSDADTVFFRRVEVSPD